MFPVKFYATHAGAAPVREWLSSLDEADRNTIGKDLLKVQYGFPLGPPLCTSLGGGLWEVRSTCSRGVEARILFSHHAATGSLVALHGFFKKTQKTPKVALDLARQRMRDFDP